MSHEGRTAVERTPIDQPAGPTVRVLIIDDHHTLAELLAFSLGHQPDLELVGHAATAAEGLTLVGLRRPDVVLMDYSLPDQDGVRTTRQIVAAYPQIRVVMLTAATNPQILAQAAGAGACAFLAKSGGLEEILEALRTARTGSMMVAPEIVTGLLPGSRREQEGRPVPRLTPRELAVLELLGQGYDANRAARQLGITLNTCRGYVKSLLLKLGCHSQLEAVAEAHRMGLIGTANAD